MKLAFAANARPEAQEALVRLRHLHGSVPEADADVIVALGGDGHMLDVLHRRLKDKKPVYGMHRGTVGFLMNEFSEEDVIERVTAAKPVKIRPLVSRAQTSSGKTVVEHAFNEVSLLRQTAQSARLKISVDGAAAHGGSAVRRGARFDTGRIDRLQSFCTRTDRPDQLQAPGPDADQRFPPAPLAGRAPSPPGTSPHRGTGAGTAPVSCSADNLETRDVVSVEIKEDAGAAQTLLFDPGHALDERILREQFNV